jgi:D-arginine dehydrogenase
VVEGGRCRGVVANGKVLRARVVVNAAGAWAGRLAAMAGALEIPLQPLRRTIAVVERDAPAGQWPLVFYGAHEAYMAPEGPGVLVSPLDEAPSPPCDAQTDPDMVRKAIERLEGLAASWSGARLHSARAGLRTFASDRRFVIGADPVLPGFVWLAGLGGWGIETSPAYGPMVTEIITEGSSAHPGAAAFDPARFA